MAKEQKYKIHSLSIDDALDLAGIFAGGGLSGQATEAISQMQTNGSAAGMQAFLKLILGALANNEIRDQIRFFLFSIWKTTEDEQATSDEMNIQDRLEPRLEDGEYVKDSLYYRKLKRFHKLPPSAAIGIARAVYESEGFEDFLESLRAFLPTTSTAPATNSNGSMGLHPVQ